MHDITDRILSAVAYREGCDILDLPPLYESVDPDALRRVVQADSLSEIEFSYNGYEIIVEQGGQVHIAAEITGS